MVKRIKASNPHGLNKGHALKFHVDFRETPEEGWRTYWPKRWEYSNKVEDSSLKTLNDKNRQASSHKFRQLIS